MASVLSVASTREAAAEDVFLPLPEGMIIGEKGAFAHESTGSACLDFFFGVVPTVPYLRFNELLAAAWEEDAHLALRLVFQTGSVRRGSGGKQDRHNYYRGLMWLFDYQEATFFANVKEIHKHTSLKCLLNILMFATHRDGPLSLEGFFQSAAAHRAHRVEIRMPSTKKSRRRERRQRQIKLREMFAREQNAESFMALRCSRGGEPVSNPLPTTRPWAGTQFIRKELDDAWSKFVELKQREFTEAAKATKRTRVASPPQDGSPLSRLYVVVAEIFAQGLREEMHAFSVGLQVPGLFAKWAPTAGGMHDKGTGIVQGIATLLSGNGPLPACENYMRNYVRPLRAAAQLPEHYLGKRAFDRVNYERMPSRCRLLYGAVYKKWDPVGYNAHLELCRQRVLSGDTSKGPSVKVDALLPHEVTAAAEKDPESVEPNLQWREMVQRCASGMESTGLFIPVCDVSGSMSGTPMEVAIALSLLLCEAQARASVFFGKVITFHEEPRMVQVQDIPEKNELGNLADRVAQVVVVCLIWLFVCSDSDRTRCHTGPRHRVGNVHRH